MENYVSREEFENLKEEVKEIKKEMVESSKLLQEIDKKIDVINEKIVLSDKTDDLRIIPLEKRVSNLEDNNKWMRNTILGSIITVVIGAIVYVIKQM